MQEKDQRTINISDQGSFSGLNLSVHALEGSVGEKTKIIASLVQLLMFSLLKGVGRTFQEYSFLLFISVFFSCCSNSLSPTDYLKWMAEHRALLSDSKQPGDVTTTLIYLPVDWLSINEASAQHPEQILAAQKEYDGLEYYRLRLAASSGSGDVLQLRATSTDEYYQRVEYFSFGLQNDLRLLVGPDTLPCRLFHFERNYGAAPYMDFMLGFDQRKGNNFDRTLIYNDRVYSNSTIQLTIPFKNINSIPNLKL